LLQINGNGFRAAIGAANRLNTGVDAVNAWAAETILTFTLVFVIFAATDSTQAVKTIHLPV
jgi:glycerol uptake facilitator-like aquaporin